MLIGIKLNYTKYYIFSWLVKMQNNQFYVVHV